MNLLFHFCICFHLYLGMYPCSDIVFARSSGISHAASPDLVNGPWEELVTGEYIRNPDIHVKCTGG